METGFELPQTRRELVVAAGKVGADAELSYRKAAPRSRSLLLASLFAAGVATGISLAYVLDDAAISTDAESAPVAMSLEHPEQPMRARVQQSAIEKSTAISSAPKADWGLGNGPPRLPDPVSSQVDGNAAPASTEEAARSAMMETLRRQIAEHRLDQPQRDNALATYQHIAARWPDDAARANQDLRAAFWLQAENARAAARWDEALHYLNILKTLPPTLPDIGSASGAPGAASSLATGK